MEAVNCSNTRSLPMQLTRQCTRTEAFGNIDSIHNVTTELSPVQILMHNIGTRRTKATQVGGRPLVELPPRELHDVPISLDKATRAAYDSWATAGNQMPWLRQDSAAR